MQRFTRTPYYTGPEREDENRFFAAATDASLFIPSAELAALQSTHNSDTFMYRFCWPSPMAQGRLGACHALDVPFVLGTLDRVPEFAGRGVAPTDVSRTMQAAWVAFARTGNPACEAVGDWPEYELTERNTLFIDRPCHVVRDPDARKRRAWARARQDGD